MLERVAHQSKAQTAALLESRKAELAAFPVTRLPPGTPDQYLPAREAVPRIDRVLKTRQPLYKLFRSVKYRAYRAKIPCTIELSDLVLPTHCPILGIELTPSGQGTGRGGPVDSAPSVDRIIPELGYVPGNVAVISWKANRLKAHGTAEEHEKIAAWTRANDNSFLLKE